MSKREDINGRPAAVKIPAVVRRFRAASNALARYKSSRFYPGTPVVVQIVGYERAGVVVTDNHCPEDQVAVRVPNGNVWWYPIETCRPNRPEVVGEKVKR